MLHNARVGGLGRALPISPAEISEVVKKLLSGKVSGVGEIHPEMLTALDIVGMFCMTHHFSTCRLADRGGGSSWRDCYNYQAITLLSLSMKTYARVHGEGLQQCLRGILQ